MAQCKATRRSGTQAGEHSRSQANYAARVSDRVGPAAPARQQVYLDALQTVPEISIHMGSFLTSEKFAGLVKPPEFRPRATLPQPWPDVVKVLKVEEKGSDVNLASHLLLDAFQNNFDVAAILSNDSDLVEPMRIASKIVNSRLDFFRLSRILPAILAGPRVLSNASESAISPLLSSPIR